MYDKSGSPVWIILNFQRIFTYFMSLMPSLEHGLQTSSATSPYALESKCSMGTSYKEPVKKTEAKFFSLP